MVIDRKLPAWDKDQLSIKSGSRFKSQIYVFLNRRNETIQGHWWHFFHFFFGAAFLADFLAGAFFGAAFLTDAFFFGAAFLAGA